ncbi:MAG TPA: choice-of-anchor Q domain-containing protein [Thermoleophilaceae bacterium]|nr:choice-of-anchor Q domain-containing protein [Thermoleophilaceae bacterium]
MVGEDRHILRLWLAFVGVVLVCLVAPALASATDRFVAKTGNDGSACTDASNPCLTIGRAVTAATTSGDTIHIGPGTYDESVSTAKNVSFIGASAGTVSDATGATVIDGGVHPAFTLTGGGALSDLRAAGGQTSEPAALELDGPSSAPGVTYALVGVIGVRNDCLGCRALDVQGGSSTDPSLLALNVSDSSFVSTDPDGTTSFVNQANANFVRSSFTGQGSDVGGLLLEAGTLTFTDGTIGAPGLGGNAEVAAKGHATFTRARLSGLRVDGNFGQSDAAVNDSLVETTQFTAAATVVFGATLTARGSTFAAEGSGAQAGADLEAGSGGDAVVNAVNSIFRANGNSGAVDVKLSNSSGHVSTFTADHSNYTSVITGGASATPAGSGSNIAGPPGFVNEAGGDFHLAAGSPLIDRGAPALPGEVDLDGSARALSANCGAPVPDIGAFEFVPAFVPPCTPTPPPQIVAPALSHVRMTHKRFRVGSPGAARAPKGTRFVYTLSAPAKVTITIERRAAGRKKGRRCVKPRRGLHKRCTRYIRKGVLTRQSPAGQSSVPFSGRIRRRALSPGRYQARLVAVNAAGRSKQQRLSFSIVRR